jgi:site-specific recombinase XerD
MAIQIMEKYKHKRIDSKIFQMKTLKSIDENLKIIARKCGIESRLTHHMGRHTYATQICLSQGVPIKTLSKMMGHQSIQTTQKYRPLCFWDNIQVRFKSLFGLVELFGMPDL